MKKFNLKLSLHELLMLEVEIEQKIQTLSEIGLTFEREKALLEKIYKLSPSDVDERLKF